jgi:hypothetical protein
MKTIQSTLVMLLFVLTAQSVLADSDGYFCSADGYLAYEWSFSQEPYYHRLYVLFLGGESGISTPIELRLPEFQLHGIKCNNDTVELLSWTDRYWVDVSDQRKLTIANVEPLAIPGVRPKEFDINLGNLRYPNSVTRGDLLKHPNAVISLTVHDFENRYELRILSFQTDTQCKRRVETYVVQLNKEGVVRKSIKLFEGIAPMECGE